MPNPLLLPCTPQAGAHLAPPHSSPDPHYAPSPESPWCGRTLQPSPQTASGSPPLELLFARPSPSPPLCAPLARWPQGHSGRTRRPAYLGQAPSAASVPRCRAELPDLGGAFIATTSSPPRPASPRPAPPSPALAHSHPESGVGVTHPTQPARPPPPAGSASPCNVPRAAPVGAAPRPRRCPPVKRRRGFLEAQYRLRFFLPSSFTSGAPRRVLSPGSIYKLARLEPTLSLAMSLFFKASMQWKEELCQET